MQITINRNRIQRGEVKCNREQMQTERLKPKPSSNLSSNIMSQKSNGRGIVLFGHPQSPITKEKIGENPN